MPTDTTQWLREEVQRLTDIEEIKQLKARYFRLVDSQAWEAWGREVFTEDFRFESEGTVVDGRDGMVAFTSRRLAGGSSVHHGFTPEITITGPDRAVGIWAMHDFVTLPPHPKRQSTIVMHGYGHYHEEYARTPDGWRIKGIVLTRLRVDTEVLDSPEPQDR